MDSIVIWDCWAKMLTCFNMSLFNINLRGLLSCGHVLRLLLMGPPPEEKNTSALASPATFGLETMAVVPGRPRKAGRRLPAWQLLETVQINAKRLRDRALQWLDDSNCKHHPLTTSSDNGSLAYLCRCKAHVNCAKKFRFVGGQDGVMNVYQLGEHTEEIDLRVPRLLIFFDE